MKFLAAICFAIVLVSIIGCNDFLDVDSQNRTTINSLRDLQGLLSAIDFDSPFLKRPSVANFMADDFQPLAGPYLESNAGGILHLLSGITWEDQIFAPNRDDEIWNFQYKAIFLCNSVLIQLENIDPSSDADHILHNTVKGEALAQRALAYFFLVNDYAKHYDAGTASSDPGVPINSSINLEQQLTRSSVAEVYDVILNDLNLALDLLPTMVEGFPNRHFRPGVNAVYGALSRIHLFREEWDEAKQAAENSLGIYKFLYDYSQTQEFPRQSWDDLEIIWDRQGHSQAPFNIGGVRNDLRPTITEEMYSLYDTTSDLRWKHFFTIEDNKIVYLRAEITSFIEYLQVLTWGISVPEVMVTLAEAQARLGDISGAMNTIDELRQKRFDPTTYVPVTANTADEALDIVLAERRKELLFTGARWLDQRRLIHLGEYNKTITRTYDGKTVSLEPSSPKYTLLIPSQIIERNPALEQNPR